ncbi:T9SS type A sorting domain-containing protein [Cytophagales bacterium RKSG123]|nr:T9SS type A sorting domain-containing protein [Xanthovirga aplysinae]
MVFSKSASQDTNNSGSFTIPSSALNGPTRMRVTMKYNGIPSPCETFSYGEVEDYTVTIEDGDGGGDDPVYCSSTGESTVDEWIGNVSLGSIDHTSGDNGGYQDFSHISTNLQKSSSYTITITPEWESTIYREGYAVWIDYNQDGDFTDPGEQVFSASATRDSQVSGSFTIPSAASEGPCRIRVSMKYNGIPSSCESFPYGEVEDYTVNIGASTRLFAEESSKVTPFSLVYPNPVYNGKVNIQINNTEKSEKVEVSFMDMNGQEVLHKTFEKLIGVQNLNLNTGQLRNGLYFIKIRTEQSTEIKSLIINQ